MKYSLDDLLKQSYEKKEIPSSDFCQTVIREMKRKEEKRTFAKTGWMYRKRMAAVICVGILFLVAVGIQIIHQGRTRNQGMHLKQEASVQEASIPMETGQPADHSGGETEESKNRVETGETTETENRVETKKPAEVQRQEETDRSSENGKNRGTEHSHSAGVFSLRTTKLHPTDQPGAKNPAAAKTETPASDAGSQKPQKTKTPISKETAVPKETLKPGKPSATTSPGEDYMQLCSLENYCYDTEYINTDIVEPSSTSGSLFHSQLIGSYEQLQNLIKKMQVELMQQFDNDLQNILTYLEGYSKGYFEKDVLCINRKLLDAGGKLELSAVTMQESYSGKKQLNIKLRHTLDQTEQEQKVKKYYISYIKVPREIAGNCDEVFFQYE